MNKFKMIQRLGLPISNFGGETSWVLADHLESLLQSAQVVYGNDSGNESVWFSTPSTKGSDTRTALVISITPIKKKTKAEAALELLQEMLDDCLPMQGSEHDFSIEAKRILEMKDEV